MKLLYILYAYIDASKCFNVHICQMAHDQVTVYSLYCKYVNVIEIPSLNMVVYDGVSVCDFAKQGQWTDSGMDDFNLIQLGCQQ